MKFIIALLTIIAFSYSLAQAKDIQLFNPDVLGQPTSAVIKLLFDKKADEIEPSTVTTDIKCGQYKATSVFYPKEVTFAQAKNSLNKLYKNFEKQKLNQESIQALWRVEDKRFAIHLVVEEAQIRIIYLQLQSAKTDLKNKDDECKE